MNVRARLFLLFAIPSCGGLAEIASETDASTPDAELDAAPPDASLSTAYDADVDRPVDAARIDAFAVSDAAQPLPMVQPNDIDAQSMLLPDGSCAWAPGQAPLESCFDDAGMQAMLFPFRGGVAGPDWDGAYAIPADAYEPNGCVALKYAIVNSCCVPAMTGPVLRDGGCCYTSCPSPICCGRPLTVGAEARVATLGRAGDWASGCASGCAWDASCDASLRRALAAAFTRDALMEHASIASFARFTLELLAFGAPHALVLEAQKAALDEVEHARLTFALASRFADAPVGPGPLDIRGVAPAATLAEVVVAAVREGCVEETLAAMVAEARAASAKDDDCRRALARIAEDEARHAELAWRFVAWAIAESPELAPVVEGAFGAALADASSSAMRMEDCDDPRMQPYGILSPSGRARVLAEGVARVIRPCVARLANV